MEEILDESDKKREHVEREREREIHQNEKNWESRKIRRGLYWEGIQEVDMCSVTQIK